MLVSGDAGYCKNRKIKRINILPEKMQNRYKNFTNAVSNSVCPLADHLKFSAGVNRLS